MRDVCSHAIVDCLQGTGVQARNFVALFLFSIVLSATIQAWAAEPVLIGDWPVKPKNDFIRQGLPMGFFPNLAIAPDGKRIAAATSQAEFLEVDVKSGVELKALSRPKDFGSAGRYETQLAYSANGNVLAALTFELNEDGLALPGKSRLRIWEQGVPRVIEVSSKTTDRRPLVAISRDGQHVAAGAEDTESIKVWSTKDGRAELEVVPDSSPRRSKLRIQHWLWLPGGQELLLYCVDRRRAQMQFIVCPMDPKASRRVLGQTVFQPDAMSLSEDGKMLITVGGAARGQEQLQFWDVAKGGEMRTPTLLSDRPLSDAALLASDYNGILAALTNERREILIFDLDRGRQLARIELPQREPAVSIALDCDGKYLSACVSPQRVKTWDLSQVLPGSESHEPTAK